MDAALELYLELLMSGADEGLRRNTLHASILIGMNDRFFVAYEGKIRVGYRRWNG